jgi:chromosome segregation ATPase
MTSQNCNNNNDLKKQLLSQSQEIMQLQNRLVDAERSIAESKNAKSTTDVSYRVLQQKNIQLQKKLESVKLEFDAPLDEKEYRDVKRMNIELATKLNDKTRNLIECDRRYRECKQNYEILKMDYDILKKKWGATQHELAKQRFRYTKGQKPRAGPMESQTSLKRKSSGTSMGVKKRVKFIL